MKDLDDALAERRAQHLYRTRKIMEGPQGPVVVIDGRQLTSFCSNDYLGLANHPEIIKALQSAADRYGVGSGASHLISGHTVAHRALEEELADFLGRERALLFSSGYHANLGTIATLVQRGDSVFEDRLNHASLIDAARLSGAKLYRYSHGDSEALQRQCDTTRTDRCKLIVTDGVFSMDGDLAPLPEIARLAERYNSALMVDDAHGLGVLGDTGQGSCEYFSLSPQQVPILMGTLGKAFGCFGAFVAGSEALVETLIQEARTYIYTTAIPAAIAEAARASLNIIKRESWRRDKLAVLIKRFRDGAEQLGLKLRPSWTPIQPLILGDNQRALQMSNKLLENGFLVTAIRPPTVPQASARLRITLSAAHNETQVDRLLSILGELQ